MSDFFIKLIQSPEALNLLENHPNAFCLLTLIAQRVNRSQTVNCKGCEYGEALIGDYKKAGIKTEGQYRWALQQLIHNGIITTRTTNKGTIAKIINSDIYDIKMTSQQRPKQRANNDPTTTNRDNKKEDICISATPPPPPRAKTKKTVYFCRQSNSFQNLDDETMFQLKEAYPHADLSLELKRMVIWLQSPKGKSRQGCLPFIMNWLARAITGLNNNAPPLVDSDEALNEYLKRIK